MNNLASFPIKIRPGGKLILVYLGAAYVIPSFLVWMNGVPAVYRDVPINLLSLCVLALTFLIYLTASNLYFQPESPPRPNFTFRFIRRPLQIAILALLLLAAVYGYMADLSGFRYSAIPMSERGSTLVFVFSLVPTILHFFLVVYLFYDRDFPDGRGLAHTTCKILLTAGLVISANGIATMLLAALGTIYVFFPNTFRRFLLRPSDDVRLALSTRLHTRIKIFALLGVLAGAGFAAWFFGEATKRGDVSSVVDLVMGAGLLEWFVNWIVSRVSPSYVSLVAALDSFALATNWDVVSEHFAAPIRSFLFRINLLTMQMFDVVRPVDGSIMRINYNLITVNPVSVREGTSPGLIAGFLYSFPYPVNFLMLFGYLIFAQRFLSRLILALPGKLTLSGWVIFLIFMLPLFASPIDLLLIIDGGTIAFVLLAILRGVLIRPTTPMTPVFRD